MKSLIIHERSVTVEDGHLQNNIFHIVEEYLLEKCKYGGGLPNLDRTRADIRAMILDKLNIPFVDVNVYPNARTLKWAIAISGLPKEKNVTTKVHDVLRGLSV